MGRASQQEGFRLTAGSIAQFAERATDDREVAGSTPARPTQFSPLNAGPRLTRRGSVPNYADAAPLYQAAGWMPLPVKGKRPVPPGATGRHGTVTPAQVEGWRSDPEWSGQNLAVRGNGWVGMDVDQYGAKQGAHQLAELEARLGPLPATISSTARGADTLSRQWFYALPEPVELVGKAAPDIDVVQAHHRYAVVWPSVHPDLGTPYVWYDAEGEPLDGPPSVDDMEYLPQAWIDHLRAEEREFAHQTEQWAGEIPTEASVTERRKLNTIIARLEGLPDVWAPGAGWHDCVRDAACWLSRIARSNAYVIDEAGAQALLLQHTPTYPSWGQEKILEQWKSAQKVTAGQFEEPPAETFPALIPLPEFPMGWTLPLVNGKPFSAVWAHDATDRAAHRRGMLVLLLQAGLGVVEAASLVWGSAANRLSITFGDTVILDPHSSVTTIPEFWKEVEEAQAVVGGGRSASSSTAGATEAPSSATASNPALTPATPAASAMDAGLELPPAPIVQIAPRRPRFLSDAERERVKGLDWWGARMISWAEQTFSYVNLPYFRMNRWTVLSVVFGTKGTLPKPGELDRPLNLYQAIVGNTTSGKSEALRVVKKILSAFFFIGDDPDIGGNHSNESLVKTLIEKDGKSTFFHLDEAHTKIPAWRRPGPYSEIPGVLTDVYDGEVGKVYRNTDKDISGRRARSNLTVHLMGTPQGMADVMGPEDWESGFLNRFLWAIGDPPSTDIEALSGGFLSEDDLAAEEDSPAVNSGESMYQQWAAEFAEALQAVVRTDGKPARMLIPAAVVERRRQLTQALVTLAENSMYAERLRPTFRRLDESVLRCAALVALSSGRVRIELDDFLIAAESAEEWAANILVMVEATDESLRTREVNMLQRAILQHTGSVPMAYLNRLPRFRNRRRDVDDLVGELVAQGLVALGGDKTVRAIGKESYAA